MSTKESKRVWNNSVNFKKVLKFKMSKTFQQLSKELQKIARREIFETEANVIDDLKIIKEWIAQTPHLTFNVDDQVLLSFIRASKHNLERAKQKIDSWCTIVTHSPDIFGSGLFNEKKLALLKLGLLLPLPRPASPYGPRIVFIRMGLINFELYKVQDFVKLYTMVFGVLLRKDDNLTVSGCVIIADFSAVKIDKFISWFLSVPLRKHAKLLIDGSAIRYKQFHLINVPMGFHTFMNLVKKVVNKKFEKRVS